MTLKAKGCLNDSRRGFVEVGIIRNNDCIFATHLRDDTLDPDLSIIDLRGTFVDPQSNLFRSGKCDVTCLWVIHNYVADFRT